MSHVALQQLALLDAQLKLALAQIESIRLVLQPVPSAKPSRTLPEWCQAYDAEQCALQSEEAKQTLASFGNPHAWRCGGCLREGGELRATG